ncbi:MAG: efflux RND transporter periplasmic adaptor subunit [Pseudomonadota bacterium]
MQPISAWKQLVILVGMVALGYAGWHQRAALFGPPDAPVETAERSGGTGIPVITAPVTTMADDMVLEVVGTGRARRSVELRAKGGGEIVGMALASNRRFEAGEVLMRLEDADQRLAVDLARTRLAEAERVLARFRQLSNTGTASTARVDEVVTAAEIARLELARAEDALDDRELRAPFAGVSGLPAVEAGAWVSEGDALATYDDRTTILVEFDLPETALSRLRPGLAVTATTFSVPGRVFDGEVVALDSRVDAASRTARVRVGLPNDEDLLRPGVSFTVRVALPGPDYPAVPELAVQFSRGNVYLWRVEGETVERVEVEMISRRAGAVLVDGDLAPGDRVVVEGTQRLSPGRTVRPDGRARQGPDAAGAVARGEGTPS